MFDRVPIILWNLLFPHKNFYMPSGDDGYIYFDLEAGDRLDRISNNELMGFIVMIASGRKVSFDYEGNNYFSTTEQINQAQFSLYARIVLK